MAKLRLTSYTFDASEKTVTAAQFSDVTLAGIQLITNVTDQIIIYNFADSTKGGTLATDTLTLEYDTTSMSDTDELMILVEDGATSLPAGTNNIGDVDVLSSALPTGAATSAKQDTQTTELTSIKTAVETIDNAIAGNEMQVDVLTMPTTTVQATNLDIRDIDKATDDIKVFANTVKDGSGTDYVPIVDADGHLQIDVLSMPAGGSGLTDAELRATPVPVSGTVTADLGATDNAVLDDIAAKLGTIDTDTGNIGNYTFSISNNISTMVGATVVDDAAFTPATTKVVMSGFEFDDTAPDSVNEGDAGAARMSANRNIYTTLRDAAGNERGANINASNQLEVAVGNTVTVTAANLDVQSGGADLATSAQAAAIQTAVEIIDNAISGSEMQVDVVAALPAGTNAIGGITGAGTNGQIKDDAFYGEDVTSGILMTHGRLWDGAAYDRQPGNSTDGMLVNLGANNDVTVTGVSTAANQTTVIGHLDGVETLLGTIDTDTGNIANSTSSISSNIATMSGATVTDDAAFTPAVTKVAMVGFEFDDTAPDSVNEGDAGAARMSANRNIYTTIRDAAGNERGVNVNASNQLAIAGPVTNAGTFAVQVDGNALTALQLIDDTVFTDDAAFTPGTSKVSAIGLQADESSTDSVDEGDVGAPRMTLDRKQIVNVQPHTAGGLSVFNATSSDGATALTSTAQAIKASAGQVYGWYIYNPNSSAQFVQFYNTASASVTVGTTNPLFMLTIPATAAANVEFTNGITFSNAGFSCAATSTAGGNGAPSTALDAVIFYK